jgi:Na+/phosphate symporter
MKILLYIGSVISVGIGIYEFTWIGKSSIAIIIILLSFIIAINCFASAKREK